MPTDTFLEQTRCVRAVHLACQQRAAAGFPYWWCCGKLHTKGVHEPCMDATLAAEMCLSLGSAVQPLTGRLGDEEAAEAARRLRWPWKSSAGTPEALKGWVWMEGDMSVTWRPKATKKKINKKKWDKDGKHILGCIFTPVTLFLESRLDFKSKSGAFVLPAAPPTTTRPCFYIYSPGGMEGWRAGGGTMLIWSRASWSQTVGVCTAWLMAAD